MSANANIASRANGQALSPSHSLNVQHLERLHYKSRENDYSPRSLIVGANKPPEYHESCRKLSSSSAHTQAESRTDSASAHANTNANASANANNSGKQQPASGIRNPHFHSTHSKYTVNGSKTTPTATSNKSTATVSFHDKQTNEIKPMKAHNQQHDQRASRWHHKTQTNINCNQQRPAAIDDDVTNRQQRTLVNLFQLYVVIVIILALVYAIYQFSAKPHNLRQISAPVHSDAADPLWAAESSNLASAKHQTLEQFLELSSARQSELEQKLHLMQKYIELMANDLQDTKERLREREKCHCSRPCASPTNMTQQYADGARWQQQCDICSCQSGKVTCQAVRCPRLTNCDEPQQVAGQCCPVCPKKCKYNQVSLKHGQSFKPNESPAKECTCLDGLIKCAPLQGNAMNARQATKQNKPVAIAVAAAALIEKRAGFVSNKPQTPISRAEPNNNSRLDEIVAGQQRH